MAAAVYSGRLFYEPSRIHAAAVYCSDGCLGEHFDDFLHDGLHLPRYDRVALPGGPVALLDHHPFRPDSSTAWEALAFLVDVHELKRVLLVAHEGCAFYSRRLCLEGNQMEERQRQDLAKASTRIREFAPHLQVDAYFGRITGNRITFEAAVATAPTPPAPWEARPSSAF